MSTADKTSTSRAGSDARKRKGYTPGARVSPPRSAKRIRQAAQVPALPTDVLDKILAFMADSRAGLSMIKLSMVNCAFRQGVSENLAAWYKLYLRWRGPIHPLPRTISTPRGVVRLRPTLPTTLPNFRTKTPPMS